MNTKRLIGTREGHGFALEDGGQLSLSEILHRWNTYPALLEALKALANTADNADGDFKDYRQALRYSVQQARAAIAAAEGKE